MDLKIIDSGWLSKDRVGTQETTDNRANDGGVITLKSVSLALSGKALLNRDPIPGSFADAPVNINGYGNDVYSLTVVVDKSKSAEYDDLSEINRLRKTKGVKLIYPSVLTDSKKSLIELLGSTSTNFNDNEVGVSTPVIMGYFEQTPMNDNATSSKFKITLRFVTTG